jgi:hypothetical protein
VESSVVHCMTAGIKICMNPVPQLQQLSTIVKEITATLILTTLKIIAYTQPLSTQAALQYCFVTQRMNIHYLLPI